MYKYIVVYKCLLCGTVEEEEVSPLMWVEIYEQFLHSFGPLIEEHHACEGSADVIGRMVVAGVKRVKIEESW